MAKPQGMFHQFEGVLRDAIVEVAMRDAPATREQKNDDLKLQAKARRKKEELTKQKIMDKATEEYIEVSYLISMYNSD